MKHLKKACAIAIMLLLVVYIAVFCWLNIVQYVQHVDSDIAAEALLAREIWEEKSLTPDNWLSSTERRIVSPATLGAVIYGLTGNMNISMGIASVCCGIAVLAALVFLMRTAKISWLGTGITCLLLLCFPVNGIQVEGGMLPYFTYLVFLFAGYYVPHIIAMLLGAGVYLRLRRGENNIFLVFAGGFCAVLVLALGASGMRCFQIVAAPLCILEIVDLYRRSERFTKRIERKRGKASLFTAVLLCSNLFGMCYPSSVQYQMQIAGAGEAIEKLVYAVPAAILECIGIAGNVPLKSFGAVMQLLVYGFAACMVFAYLFLYKHRTLVKESAVSILDFFLYSLLFTIFVVSVTSIVPYSYYFFIILFMMASAIGILADLLVKRYHLLSYGLIGIVCVYAVMNLYYTYLPALTVTDNQKEYEEVVSFMQEEGIEYGYAQFWDANRLAVVSNGSIKVGNLSSVQSLQMYWWLTNLNWYVPKLPEAMKTAYVIKKEEQENFLTGTAGQGAVEEAFSNDKFVVYTSQRNLVTR